MNYLKLFAASAAVVLVTGCSSFNRDYKRVAASLSPSDNLTGAWDGHWRSDKNGHNGRLRCIMTPKGGNIYDARFRARYFKILAYEYNVPLTVQGQGTNFTFEGSANLGKLAGGLYTYKGTATAAQLNSTYSCKWDHGKFELVRPARAK
jgi:hypothetical protein